MNLRRVLVTGGAGFLGSHLCDRLVPAGANTFPAITEREHEPRADRT